QSRDERHTCLDKENIGNGGIGERNDKASGPCCKTKRNRKTRPSHGLKQFRRISPPNTENQKRQYEQRCPCRTPEHHHPDVTDRNKTGNRSAEAPGNDRAEDKK